MYVLRRRDSRPAWNAVVKPLLSQHKALLRKSGLDSRLSAGFIRQEVLMAEELITCVDQGVVQAFCFLKTDTSERALCIPLICAPQAGRGYGKAMLSFVLTSERYGHEYCALRATHGSLQFYMKMGFQPFNHATLYNGFVPRTDNALRELLHADDLVAGERRVSELGWKMHMNSERDEEFALTKARSAIGSTSMHRSSKRLRSIPADNA